MADSLVDMALILTRLDSIDQRLDGTHVSPWLTTAEAANYLRCSPRKIEDLTRRGLLPFFRQDPISPRSARRYNKRSLTAFLITGQSPQQHRLSPHEKRLVEELL